VDLLQHEGEEMLKTLVQFKPAPFGISGSGVAELRAAGLRLGNRSLHSTFRSGGSGKLSVTGRCSGMEPVMEPACSPEFLSRWSISLTFQK
jgi:hypothetical protein